MKCDVVAGTLASCLTLAAALQEPDLAEMNGMARATVRLEFTKWRAAVLAGDTKTLTALALVDHQKAIASFFRTPSAERDSLLKNSGAIRRILKTAPRLNDLVLSYRVPGGVPHAFVCVTTRPRRAPGTSADLMRAESQDRRRSLFCTFWIEEDRRWQISYDFVLPDE